MQLDTLAHCRSLDHLQNGDAASVVSARPGRKGKQNVAFWWQFSAAVGELPARNTPGIDILVVSEPDVIFKS